MCTIFFNDIKRIINDWMEAFYHIIYIKPKNNNINFKTYIKLAPFIIMQAKLIS